MTKIFVCNANTHNLKKVSCSIPHGSLCCITGVSGSGKSSFAFDTLFIEGERRYIQSLSHHAKRIIGNLPQPEVDSITGLTPTIAIEQKTSAGSPRSTVGTLTEIYDHLRVLYAKMATPYCPISLEPLIAQTKADIIRIILEKFSGKKMIVLAPWGKDLKGTLKEHFEKIEQKGFSRVYLDGSLYSLSCISHIDPNSSHILDVVIDRIEISFLHQERLHDSVSVALEIGSGLCYLLDQETDEKELFSESAFAKTSGQFYPKLEPQDFSFNTPSGMCEACQGLGITQEFILEKIIDEEKSLAQDCCVIAGSYATIHYRNIYDNLAHIYSFSVDTPWKNLSSQAKNVLLYGTEKKWTRMVFINPNTGSCWYDTVRWQGILHEAKKKYQEAKSKQYKQKMEEFLVSGTCPSCHGSRIKPYPAAARFHGFTIQDLTAKTIDDLLSFFSSLASSTVYAEDLLLHIRKKLEFLHKVGAGYLSLDRGTLTLSGGEFQRVKLASHLGCGLTGITYVLDEPSIGLHQHDTHKLIAALFSLRKGGNTVLVVEHDPSIMRASDWIIDFGPGAGTEGGEVLFEGSFSKFKNADSLTSAYLFDKKRIERRFPEKKPTDAWLTLQGASLHNLKKDTLAIPLGLFVAITGVSGSGKSSLLIDTLYPALSNRLMHTNMPPGPYSSLSGIEHLDKVIHIDQSPIGRTPRSNPATYSSVFDDIRILFASLPESKVKGWSPGRFSFNVKEGSCPVCTGMGMTQLNVDFLEDTWIQCTECQGKRFDQETLSVLYKNASIHDVLFMTCKEALQHFSSIPQIKKSLEILCRVGLDYIQLGQSSTTLSGGEAQRLKIAKELARPATGKTLYLLDEPTTGLHFHDLSRLLDVLHELVDRKNTVLVIEHNIDLVKTADWIIDLGPGAGEQGGHIIAQGPPKEVMLLDTPTGNALRSTTTEKKQTSPTFSKELPSIKVQGARQHNLKNLTFSLPKNKLITLIGPSGSGKASLAFDTLFAEGQRKYVESLSPYARQFIHQMPKPAFDIIEGMVPAVAIEQRRHASNPRSTVGTMTEIYDYLRIIFACHGIAHCPRTGAPITTISKERISDILLSQKPQRTFLFAPLAPLKSTALLPEIEYLKKLGYSRVRIDGTVLDTNVENIPQIPSGRLVQLDVLIDRLTPSPDEKSRLIQSIGEACRLSNERILIIQEGKERFFNLAFAVEETGESFPTITPHTFSFSSPHGMCEECQGLGVLIDSYDDEETYSTASKTLCPTCRGARLNPLARAVTLSSKNLPDLCALPMQEIALWLKNTAKTLTLEKSIAHAFKECEERLLLAEEIGIGYLSLDRNADTLSMGEAERVYLLSQIGSRLSELLYVIDYPTVGLHVDDTTRLLKVFHRLKCLGNTLLLIENNKQCIKNADHIIELGKEGGKKGGEILFEGPYSAFLQSTTSQTSSYFQKKQLPSKTQSFSSFFSFASLSCHNLKKISLTLPTHALIAIVGVSGSGKSTLLFDVIEKSMLAHLDHAPLPYSCKGLDQFSRLVSFDQKPQGTTSRSDLYSYLDLSTCIREFYASLPLSIDLGLTPSHFSTSHRNGMCPHCFGLGYTRVDMYFLPPVVIPCEACHGLRFKEKILSVEYLGVSIGKFLALPLREARALFSKPSKITRTLDALIELNLDYLSLGQEMTTLSFSEVQRIKLAKELSYRRKKSTLYLFDEPTIGLHAREVETLVQKLYHLRDEGHSLILIEHNLDVISLCDYIVELGPEGGCNGGYILAEGDPRSLSKNPASRMGQLLKNKDSI